MNPVEALRRRFIAEWGMHLGDVLTFNACAYGCPSPKHRGVLAVKYQLVGQPVGNVNLLCWPGRQTCIGLKFATKREKRP